jgi:uncharacterized protein YjbJ (UPF0337 family)
MHIDENKITTQDELEEPAPIDQVEERVEARMKTIEGNAKKNVGDGLQDDRLAKEGEKLTAEGERALRDAREKST